MPRKADGSGIDRRVFVSATAGFGIAVSPVTRAQPSNTTSRPLPPVDRTLFNGFEARWVHTDSADIFLRHGGKGPPVLLLHGNPQSHACWHQVATHLAQNFYVVAADLRGYGDSIGPADGGKQHINYSFRTMARDQVDV